MAPLLPVALTCRTLSACCWCIDPAVLKSWPNVEGLVVCMATESHGGPYDTLETHGRELNLVRFNPKIIPAIRIRARARAHVRFLFLSVFVRLSFSWSSVVRCFMRLDSTWDEGCRLKVSPSVLASRMRRNVSPIALVVVASRLPRLWN